MPAPNNPRIVPASIFCPQTNAFLEAPGKQFWESPGRARRSGAKEQAMVARAVEVVKHIHGAGIYDIGLGSHPDSYDFAFTRYMNFSMSVSRDRVNFSPSSTGGGVDSRGVPTTGMFTESFVDFPFTPAVYHPFFPRVGLWPTPYIDYFDNQNSGIGFFDADIRSLETPGNPIVGHQSFSVSNINPVEPIYNICRNVCDSHVLESWDTFPNGHYTAKGFHDFTPVYGQASADDYASGNWNQPLYNGSLYTQFTGTALSAAYSSWQLLNQPGTDNGGAFNARVAMRRSDYRFPANDALNVRAVTVFERRVSSSNTSAGIVQVFQIDQLLLPRGQFRSLPVPDWMPKPVIERTFYAV